MMSNWTNGTQLSFKSKATYRFFGRRGLKRGFLWETPNSPRVKTFSKTAGVHFIWKKPSKYWATNCGVSFWFQCLPLLQRRTASVSGHVKHTHTEPGNSRHQHTDNRNNHIFKTFRKLDDTLIKTIYFWSLAPSPLNIKPSTVLMNKIKIIIIEIIIII